MKGVLSLRHRLGLAAAVTALCASALPAEDDTRPDEARKLLEQVAAERAVAREMALEEIQTQWKTARQLLAAGREAEALRAFETLRKVIRDSPEPAAFSELQAQSQKEMEQALARLKEKQARQDALVREQAREILEAERRKAAETRTGQVSALMQDAQRAYEAGDPVTSSRLCSEAMALSPGNAAARSLKMLSLNDSLHDRLERVERTRTQAKADLMVSATEAATPLPAGQIMAYPSPERWQQITEARRKYRQPKADKPMPAWEIEIRQKLKKPLSAQFDHTPLQDVLQFIQDATDVNIVFDRSAGRNADDPVTLQINKMTAKSALDWVMKLTDLDYAIMDEAVFVSNRERFKKMAPEELRIYDFEDFLRVRRAFAAGRAGGGADVPGKEETAADWIEFLKKVLEAESAVEAGAEKQKME
jgi:hypothetical protein